LKANLTAREEMLIPFSHQDENEKNPIDTEAYYEKLASQEEIYLEEIEETARARLIAYDQRVSQNGG
jgi:hypothetical protein